MGVTYSQPTTLWRLERDGHIARAVIVPHLVSTALVWWINEQVQEVEDFSEWSDALKTADELKLALALRGWEEQN